MEVNVKRPPIQVQDILKLYDEIPPYFSDRGKNIEVISREFEKNSFKRVLNSSSDAYLKRVLNSSSDAYLKFEPLSLPNNVNEKSKSFFEMYFPKKINASHQLSYYLGCNNELSIILQSVDVTRTFVFQVNSKIRFTIKKRHDEKSLLQGEFTPLQISKPRDYIEKLINFFE